MFTERCSIPRFFRLALATQFLFLAHCSLLSAQQIGRNNQLLVEHGSRLLIKKKSRPEVVLVSIVSDPILSSSRAHVHTWSFDNIEQITRYLNLQDQAGVVTPKEIQLSRSKHFSVTSFEKFVIGGIEFQWCGGNSKASWLAVNDPDSIKVVNAKRMDQNFRLRSSAFEPWKEFIERYNAEIYQKSWTEFDTNDKAKEIDGDTRP